MPAVSLPDDLIEQLKQSDSGKIYDTNGPGVAAYLAPDRRTHADIYIGLTLDGLKHFQNISFVYPNIKMQFSLKPVVSCQSDVLAFNPADSAMTIQVRLWHSYTGRSGVRAALGAAAAKRQ